jgi:PAS domain S-box-containing protein
MGEKITRHPKSADVRRANLLKEALRSGSPPVLRHSQPSPGPTQEPASRSWIKDSLEVQKAYLEQLVEGIPEAISIIESPYQITRINTEFTRMFGFTPEEAVGQRIDALIVPPERHAETRWIGETLQKGQKIRLETKRRRKDGTLVGRVYLRGAGDRGRNSGRRLCALSRHLGTKARGGIELCALSNRGKNQFGGRFAAVLRCHA